MWHLLADIHFDIKSLPRLQSFFNFYLKRFEQTCPKHVIFLGDTFNVRTGTDAHLHRVFSDYLRQMLDAPQSPQIHLLVGNHDMKNKLDRTDNALYPFSLIRNRVKVYQEITQTCIDGHKAVFIPYHHDEAQVARYIRTQPCGEVESTIAFFHGSFRGAVRNGASDSGHSVCHDSVIDSTNLGRYHRAFLGHFHTHGSPSPCLNVTYVGSPIQSNMGDAGDLKRGYIEYDPKVGTWSLVANPDAEYYLNISCAESVANPACVRGKKVRVTLKTADQASGVWTGEAVQRQTETLYGHGAEHVEWRQASRPNDIPKSLDAGKVIKTDHGLLGQEFHDDVVSTMPSMVQSFLRAESKVTESADCNDKRSLMLTREDYLLSIIEHQQQQHGVATPATTFHADLMRIEMYNFRGIAGRTSLDLDVLSRGTVFLVTSNNGSGKSTLLEAIFWCLYGKFLDPEVSANEIIHTGKRSCTVALYFRNGYTFIRSRVGKRPKFEILYQGTVVERGHDAGTTTQYVESYLLHMTSEAFRRTIVIADHASSAFLATRDAQRTKSLDIIFGLEMLRDLRSRLEEDSAETRKRWMEVQSDCDKASEALKTLAVLRQRCLSELEDCSTAIECKKTALQILRGNNSEVQNQLQQKEASSQRKWRTLETLKAKIAKLRHQIRLYQTMERIKRAQAEVERYQVALASEENRQKLIWVRAHSLLCRFNRRYFIPFISIISYVSFRVSWLNRFFAPAVHRYLTRLTSWASPPAPVFSQDGLNKLMREVQKTEAIISVLKEGTRSQIQNSHGEAHSEDMRDAKEVQAADLCSVDDLQLPQISQLVQQVEEYLLLAEEEHTRIKASVATDERDRSALSQETHNILCDIAHQDGQLQPMIRQETLCSQWAEQLMQQHEDLLRSQERNVEERSKVEAKRALSIFWLEQLHDTATQKGPFITYCRARHVHKFNSLIAQVLDELNQDSEGIANQCLDFQLKQDYTLETINGALSIGKRSKGQKTRTYLALFLAMFHQTRSRLPFRSSFVFLDEVMDTLDLHGIEALQRWLQRYVATRGIQAFLMTHRETSLIGNVIEVIKTPKRGTVYKLRQEERRV
jgi:hypothetical protein